MNNKWINQSTRPILANKALRAIRELDWERCNSETLVDDYDHPGKTVTFVTAKIGIGWEAAPSNIKAHEIYTDFCARHNFTITDENVRVLAIEAKTLREEAKKHRPVVDERKAVQP